jgi:hypothetical protein
MQQSNGMITALTDVILDSAAGAIIFFSRFPSQDIRGCMLLQMVGMEKRADQPGNYKCG